MICQVLSTRQKQLLGLCMQELTAEEAAYLQLLVDYDLDMGEVWRKLQEGLEQDFVLVPDVAFLRELLPVPQLVRIRIQLERILGAGTPVSPTP